MRQNLTVALLSVIATLLVVLVVQNLNRPVILAQTGGGAGATVGSFGVATGKIQGADAAGFWIYNPEANRILVYDMGNTGTMRLRSVRNVEYDLKANDFNLGRKNTGPTVAEVKKATDKETSK